MNDRAVRAECSSRRVAQLLRAVEPKESRVGVAIEAVLALQQIRSRWSDYYESVSNNFRLTELVKAEFPLQIV